MPLLYVFPGAGGFLDGRKSSVCFQINFIMLRLFFIVLSFLVGGGVIAQNIVSQDRKFIACLYNGRLTVKSLENNWSRKWSSIKCNGFDFTSDSRSIILNYNDSLFFFDLYAKTCEYKSKAVAFQLAKGLREEWLVCHTHDCNKSLVLSQLRKGEEIRFDDVAGFNINQKGSELLLKIEPKDKGNKESVLVWINIITRNSKVLWDSRTDLRKRKILSYVFDSRNSKLAFVVESEDKLGDKEIWYFDSSMVSPVCKLKNFKFNLSSNLKISSKAMHFTKNGSKLIFSIYNEEGSNDNTKQVKCDVWSYLDSRPQSIQLREIKQNTEYLAVLDIQSGKSFQLTFDNERIVIPGIGGVVNSGFVENANDRFQVNDRYALVNSWPDQLGSGIDVMMMYEYNWNRATYSRVYLVDLETGERRIVNDVIKPASSSLPYYMFSTGLKFVLYYDQVEKGYFSYEIATGKKRNITGKTSTNWYYGKTVDRVSKFYNPVGVAGWYYTDSSVLLYDQNRNVWAIDLKAEKVPRNLTQLPYSSHQYQFELLGSINNVYIDSDILLFKAFNTSNFNESFFQRSLALKTNMHKLIEGPYKYEYQEVRTGTRTLQPSNVALHFIERQSATEPPALYCMRDNGEFDLIDSSRARDDKSLKLNRRLIKWHDTSGKELLGILYFSGNFDSTRKYPLIFRYYESECARSINSFYSPKQEKADPKSPKSESTLNVGYCVEAGYLVFWVDIHYEIGYPGESALKSIISAVNVLSKLRFVDTSRMGIQGQSWGGYQTNYIVTHSNLFKAACSSAGVSNMVSFVGNGNEEWGKFDHSYYEVNQGRVGYSLWQRPDLYIQNSPIFSVHRVTTPVLLMNNKKDYQFYLQGVEFMSALRRLGKRAWMIQYDDGYHSINGKSAEDWGNKMMQFFDHYLKDAPAPRWMLEGVPAKMKGVMSNMELVEKKDAKTGKWVSPPVGGLFQ